MSIIQFETGEKVEFDGEPTQADIEEVYSSIRTNPIKTPTQDTRTFTQKALPRLSDTGLSFLSGIYGAKEGITGIADIFTGGRVGKFVEGAEKKVLGSTSKEMIDYLATLKSDEGKIAQQKVKEAKGFGGTVEAMLENPSTIANAISESIPSMLAGGVVSRSLGGLLSLTKYGLKISPRILGAIGEGSISGGSTAEQARQESSSGLLTGSQSAVSGASGILTGSLGIFGGKVAQKLGVADVDTLMAGGATEAVKKNILVSALKGALSESATEELPQSMQEQIANNINAGKPWDEGVAEAGATGALTAFAMGGAVSGISQGMANMKNKDIAKIKDDIIADNKDNPYVQEFVAQEKVLADVMESVKASKETETPDQIVAKLVEAGIDENTAMSIVFQEDVPEDYSLANDIISKLDEGMSQDEVSLYVANNTNNSIEQSQNLVSKISSNKSSVIEDTTKELNTLSEKVDKSVLKKTAVDLQNDFERVQSHIDEQVRSIQEKVDNLKERLDNAEPRSTEKKRLKVELENARGELRDTESSFYDKVAGNAKAFRSFVVEYAKTQGLSNETAEKVADQTSDIVTGGTSNDTIENIVSTQIAQFSDEINALSTKNRRKEPKTDKKVSKDEGYQRTVTAGKEASSRLADIYNKAKNGEAITAVEEKKPVTQKEKVKKAVEETKKEETSSSRAIDNATEILRDAWASDGTVTARGQTWKVAKQGGVRGINSFVLQTAELANKGETASYTLGEDALQVTADKSPIDGFVNVEEISKTDKVTKDTNASTKTEKIYHGTPHIFDKFDVSISGGSIWFSNKKETISETGLSLSADQKLNVMERLMPYNIKLADEDLNDKLTKDQLIQEGYDGVKYDNGDGEFYYEIFDPENTLLKDGEKTLEEKAILHKKPSYSDPVEAVVKENLMSEIQFYLEASEAGRRIFVPQKDSMDYEIKAVSSTFPQFVPEKWRSRKTFDQLRPYWEAQERPSKKTPALQALYDVFDNYVKEETPKRIEEVKKAQENRVVEDSDIPFKVQDEANLVVHHNLTENNLIHADELGGLPVPSIAISNKDNVTSAFGDIILIGNKEMIDPAIKSNKVYNADSYSARYPTVQYEVGNRKLLDDDFKKAKEYFSDKDVIRDYEESEYMAQSVKDDGGKYSIARSRGVKAVFAMQKGASKTMTREEIDTFAKDNSDDFASFVKGVKNNFGITSSLFNGYTYSGQRKKGLPHTIENVVKKMKGTGRTDEGFNYGVGSLRSAVAKKFKNIKQIQADRSKLISNEEMMKLKEQTTTEFDDLMVKHNVNDHFRFSDNIVDYELGKISATQLKQYTGIDDVAIKEFEDFGKRLAEMPSEYFEAKLQRAVDINEFKVAVVPEDISKEAEDILVKNGLTIEKYGKDNRQEAIDKATVDGGALFKIKKYKFDTDYSVRDASNYLNDLKSRLGIDFDVNFVDSILVDYKVDPLKKTKEKRFAYGVYLDNTIAIANDIASYTAEHESVHLTLANMYRIQAFKNEGLTKDKVMQAMANQMGVVLSDKTKLDVEEQIAYDFELYTHDKKAWADEIAKRTGEKPSSVLAKFYEVLKKLIMQFAEAISLTQGDVIKNYYEILADGVENNKQMLKFQNNGLIQSYIEDGELSIYTLEKEKSEALSKFKLREESDAYLQKTKKTFNELVDKSQKLITDTEAWKADIDKKLIEKAKTAEIVDETRADVKEASRFTTRNKPPVGSLTKRGEEIVTTLDFKNKDEAQKEISDYLLRKTQLIQTVKQLRALSLQISNAKKEGKATRKELRDVARRLKLRKKLLEQKEFYVNMGKGQGKKEAFSMIQKRNRVIRDTQELFGISDAKAKELIGSKRINQMSEKQFNEFLTWFTNNAQLQQSMMSAREEVQAILFEKQFQKEDNLRKALGLPPLNQMTEAQATMYAGVLYTYQFGDVFLTKREMETSARTKYEDIRTERELIQKIEEVAGIPRGELKTIDATSSDRGANWYTLSRKNLFYNWLVEKKMLAKAKEIQQVYAFRKQLDILTKNARKSRSNERNLKESIWQSIAPTDKYVYEALDTGNFENLTKEEKLLADFLSIMFRDKYEKIVKNFKDFKGRENYVTHLNRDFFETWRDTGSIREGFKSLYQEHKDSENAIEILAGKTGEVLAFDKFLPYMLPRVGEGETSKNVSRIALTYFTATTRKELLDEFIPEAMLTLHGYKVLTGQTKMGLEKKPFLETFTKEYLNNAKGRKIEFVTRQGSPIDALISIFSQWLSFKYIGGNPILAFMNLPGDLTFLAIGTTNKEKLNSLVRLFSSNKASEAIRGLVGENPIKDVLNTQEGILNGRIFALWFFLMSSSSYIANQFSVRGMLTTEEFNTGVITDERLIEMAKKMNKFKLTDSYGKSLIGSTTVGAISAKFKTFALPLLQTGLNDIYYLAKDLIAKDFNVQTKKDAIELAKITIIASGMFFLVKSLMSLKDDEDKDSYLWRQIENNLNSIYLTFLMLIDSKSLGFVAIGELQKVQDLLMQLATQERYKKASGDNYVGDLKAMETLKKIIIPSGATRIFNVKEDNRTPKETLIEESVKSGEFDAEEIAMKTSMNWGEKTESQRQNVINKIKQEHTVLTKYPDSKVVGIVLGENNNKDRVQKLLKYSEKVGVETVYEEMKALMKDRELYANQEKYTGAFISAELFRDFQLARKKLQNNK